jgi:hypothetical protein
MEMGEKHKQRASERVDGGGGETTCRRTVLLSATSCKSAHTASRLLLSTAALLKTSNVMRVSTRYPSVRQVKCCSNTVKTCSRTVLAFKMACGILIM